MPIRINGATSGYVELKAPDVAGTTIVTLPSSSTSLVNATPFGAVIPFAGSTAPDGWLLCYGQAISRTTYASLFAVISTTYGTGDGSTTFNVPDLRGRVAAGLDNMGGSDAGRLDWANSLGTSGGAQTHTLTESEMPNHRHTSPTTKNTGGGAGVYYGQGGDVQGQFTGYTGGGGAHNNMQPTFLLNYIIKAL